MSSTSNAPAHPLAHTLPLFGLELRTPRLVLRPVWDEDINGLTDAAVAGIHPADEMPFAFPWTRDPRPALLAGTAKTIWRERGWRAPHDWSVSFAVRRIDDGDTTPWWEMPVIGRQDVTAKDFNILRSVGTGSWLTSSEQGKRLGKEMRLAVLLWAFDHLGATEGTSSAYNWNAKSMGVSLGVGYSTNGERRVIVEGRMEPETLLRVTPDSLMRPEWTLQTQGDQAGIRAELGILPPDGA